MIKFNKEYWVLLNGYEKGFQTYIFEKNGKYFRTKRDDVKIGLEISKEEICFTEQEYRIRQEYINMKTFERVFGNLDFYAYEYSTEKDMKENYPEIFI